MNTPHPPEDRIGGGGTIFNTDDCQLFLPVVTNHCSEEEQKAPFFDDGYKQKQYEKVIGIVQ